MTIEIHAMPMSAPCRIAIMTAEKLAIDYKYVLVNLNEGDHLKPEFLKLNPQHSIPVLNDNGFIVNESRPIATYLCNKYDKNDKIYPKDSAVRANVDARLYFDMGTFYKAFIDFVYPLLFGTGVPDKEMGDKKFQEIMGWVTDFIKPTGYVAGTNHLTVADIAFLSTYSCFEAVGHFDLAPYPEVKKWFERVKREIPNYEECNGKGASQMGLLYRTNTGKGN